jgi:plastocyanin
MEKIKENIQPIIATLATIIIIAGLGYYWYTNRTNPGVDTELPNQTEAPTPSLTPSALPTQKPTPLPPGTTPEATPTSPRAIIEPDGTYLVYYENDGFMPKNISLQSGKSVKFINNSDKSLRVTTKTTDREFKNYDQTTSVGKGETYKINISIKGLWQFENMNEKTHFGSIAIY